MNASSTQRTAIAYLRVSTRSQGISRHGLDAQLRDIKAFAECNGIELVDCVTEIASGGLSLDKRPVLAGAIENCKKNGALLIVSKLCRLSRSVQFVSSLMNEFSRTKMRLVSVNHGLEADNFTLHLFSAVHELERKQISERTKKGLESARAKGVVLGYKAHRDGGASFAQARGNGAKQLHLAANVYANSMKPTIQPMREQGLSYAAIAERLESCKVPTQKGGRWSITSVKRLCDRFD